MKRPAAIEISIPKPCAQDWAAMQVQQDGRFCNHCQHQVVDFTKMTDAALLAHVQKNGFGCGRFENGQLNRVIKPVEVPWRKFWPQVMLSLGLFLSVQKVNAQAVRARKPASGHTVQPVQSRRVGQHRKAKTRKHRENIRRAASVNNITVGVITMKLPDTDSSKHIHSQFSECHTPGKARYGVDLGGGRPAPPLKPLNVSVTIEKPRKTFWQKLQFWK